MLAAAGGRETMHPILAGREQIRRELHQWSQPALAAKSWWYNGWFSFPKADDVGVNGLEREGGERAGEREREGKMEGKRGGERWRADNEIDAFYLCKSAGRRISSGHCSETEKRACAFWWGKGQHVRSNPSRRSIGVTVGRNSTSFFSLAGDTNAVSGDAHGCRADAEGPCSVRVRVCVPPNSLPPTMQSSLGSLCHLSHIQTPPAPFSFIFTIPNLNIHCGLIPSNHEFGGLVFFRNTTYTPINI